MSAASAVLRTPPRQTEFVPEAPSLPAVVLGETALTKHPVAEIVNPGRSTQRQRDAFAEPEAGISVGDIGAGSKVPALTHAL